MISMRLKTRPETSQKQALLLITRLSSLAEALAASYRAYSRIPRDDQPQNNADSMHFRITIAGLVGEISRVLKKVTAKENLGSSLDGNYLALWQELTVQEDEERSNRLKCCCHIRNKYFAHRDEEKHEYFVDGLISEENYKTPIFMGEGQISNSAFLWGHIAFLKGISIHIDTVAIEDIRCVLVDIAKMSKEVFDLLNLVIFKLSEIHGLDFVTENTDLRRLAMPAHDPIEILLAHNRWANRIMFQACESLSHEQFHQRFEMGMGSLHDTALHILSAMRGWGDLLAQREQRGGMEEEGEKTPAQLIQLMDELTDDMEASAKAHAPDGDVTGERGGKSYTFKRGAVLTHVTTHGLHHRAQMLNMLRQLGVEELPRLGVAMWILQGEER